MYNFSSLNFFFMQNIFTHKIHARAHRSVFVLELLEVRDFWNQTEPEKQRSDWLVGQPELNRYFVILNRNSPSCGSKLLRKPKRTCLRHKTELHLELLPFLWDDQHSKFKCFQETKYSKNMYNTKNYLARTNSNRTKLEFLFSTRFNQTQVYRTG